MSIGSFLFCIFLYSHSSFLYHLCMSIQIFKGLIWDYDNKEQFLKDMSDFYKACHTKGEDGFTKRANECIERMKKKKYYEY